MKKIFKFLNRIIDEPIGYTHEISISKKPKIKQLRKWNNYINKKQLNGILAMSHCATCKEHNHKTPFHFEYIEKRHFAAFMRRVLYNNCHYENKTWNKLEALLKNGGI